MTAPEGFAQDSLAGRVLAEVGGWPGVRLTFADGVTTVVAVGRTMARVTSTTVDVAAPPDVFARLRPSFDKLRRTPAGIALDLDSASDVDDAIRLLRQVLDVERSAGQFRVAGP